MIAHVTHNNIVVITIHRCIQIASSGLRRGDSPDPDAAIAGAMMDGGGTSCGKASFFVLREKCVMGPFTTTVGFDARYKARHDLSCA